MAFPDSRLLVRRIEPQILSAPNFYGSPGEPGLYSSPTVGGNLAPVQFSGVSMASLLALLAGSGLLMRSDVVDQEINHRTAEGKIKSAEDIMPEELNFGKAFAKARRMGLKEFSWRGRRFNTRYAKEVKDATDQKGR